MGIIFIFIKLNHHHPYQTDNLTRFAASLSSLLTSSGTVTAPARPKALQYLPRSTPSLILTRIKMKYQFARFGSACVLLLLTRKSPSRSSPKG